MISMCQATLNYTLRFNVYTAEKGTTGTGKT